MGNGFLFPQSCHACPHLLRSKAPIPQVVPCLAPGYPCHRFWWHQLCRVELFFSHLHRAETMACRISRCHYTPISRNPLLSHPCLPLPPQDRRNVRPDAWRVDSPSLCARACSCQACTTCTRIVVLEAPAPVCIRRHQLDNVLSPHPLIRHYWEAAVSIASISFSNSHCSRVVIE